MWKTILQAARLLGAESTTPDMRPESLQAHGVFTE